MGDAAVDGVLKASLGLIGYGDCGLGAVGHGEVHQELRHVARTEHLVDGCEVRRALLVAEVGREHAPLHALPPQELAGSAGRSKSCHLHLENFDASLMISFFPFLLFLCFFFPFLFLLCVKGGALSGLLINTRIRWECIIFS